MQERQQQVINAFKMVMDALMIGQLCERRDFEDRKQIGIFGLKENKKILNPMANYREEVKPKTQKQAASDTIPDVDTTPAHRCPHTPQPI